VVVIDLAKVSRRVVDVSTPELARQNLRNRVAQTFAIQDRVVLVYEAVDAAAILGFAPGFGPR
jgi:hypothetical protein